MLQTDSWNYAMRYFELGGTCCDLGCIFFSPRSCCGDLFMFVCACCFLSLGVLHKFTFK